PLPGALPIWARRRRIWASSLARKVIPGQSEPIWSGQSEGRQEMKGLENATVTAVDELAMLYAQPMERVLKKEIDHVDAVGRAFIGASPFLVLATGSSHGLDCS